MKNPKISVIIAMQKMSAYGEECVQHLLRQDYSNFEIILLPDFAFSSHKFGKHVRVVPTGPIQPAEKRNKGAREARGEILAFIDDDAYPLDRKWLSRSAEYLIKPDVGAVGGPNFTPPQDGTFQVVCGEVLASSLFSGPASKRYKKAQKGEYNDLPSCNLLVKKKAFSAVGGFYPHFWPGEDTKLCADIARQGKKVLYDPDIAVYHHRRRGLENYLRQTFRFGLHRGYFMWKFPYTSLRPLYFMPLLFVVGLFLGPWLGLINPFFLYAYIAAVSLYFLLILIESRKSKRIATIPIFIFLGIATHIAYGLGVLVGLVRPRLHSRLKPKTER